MTDDTPKTVAQLLNEMAADICNNYCKYPEIYGDLEGALEEEHCMNCPLGVIG